MNIKSFGDKMFMNYEFFSKQPIERIESKLKMKFSENPLFINSLDVIINQLLFRNYSKTPVNIQKRYMIIFTSDYNCSKIMITKMLILSINTYFYQCHLVYFYYALLV